MSSTIIKFNTLLVIFKAQSKKKQQNWHTTVELVLFLTYNGERILYWKTNFQVNSLGWNLLNWPVLEIFVLQTFLLSTKQWKNVWTLCLNCKISTSEQNKNTLSSILVDLSHFSIPFISFNKIIINQTCKTNRLASCLSKRLSVGLPF